jgi:hypothetical protein
MTRRHAQHCRHGLKEPLVLKFDQTNPTHRLLMAVAAAALVTFVVWGVWMSLGAVFGGLGWVFSQLGDMCLWVMDQVTAVHGVVAWIALGCGVVVGVILGLNVRVDRFWSRLSRRPPQVSENS